MPIFAILSLTSFAVFLFTGTFVYYRNPKSPLNRTFLAICLSMSLWAFSEFMYRQAEGLQAAHLWVRVRNASWPYSISFMLFFILALTERTNLLKRKTALLAIFVPACLFSLLGLTTNLITTSPVREFWGYTYGIPRNPWAYLAAGIWSVAVTFCVLFLSVQYFLATTDKNKKLQAQYISLGFGIPIISGIITEVLLPLRGIRIPELSNISGTFLATFVGYAIWRYELFSVSPSIAADTIISTMCDSLILVDLEGRIVTANKATLDLLGYREGELLGQSVGSILGREFVESQVLNRIIEEGPVVNQEWTYCTKTGETKPVLFSGSPVKDKRGDVIGIIGISRDITERKRAEEAVRESETRFKELADLLPQTVFEFDEQGKFTFVNRNAFPMFGFSPDDIEKGLKVLQAIVPEDRDRARENVQKALSKTKAEASEYTFIRKNGSTFPAIVYSSPVLKDNKPVGLRGIVIDITDRKQVEEALRESEKRYRILADNAGDLIFTLDMSLRFTYVSPSVSQLLGYTPEEVTDQGVGEVLAPDSAEVVFKAFAEEMAREASGANDPSRERVMELKLVGKDKTTVWGEVKMSFLREPDGRPTGVLGVSRDITERKRTQEALRQSEERLRALFDHAAAGMALVDTDGYVLAMNQANCRFLGYSQEEIVGMHFADFVHPEDQDADAALYESLLQGQRDSYVMDKRYVRRHGEIVWGRLSVSLVRGQNRQPQYTAIVCEDITDRKRAEEDIQESEARYRSIMEQSPDGIFLVDMETRQIMEANSTFQKMLDYTYSETLGLSFPDFVEGKREDLDQRFMDVLLGKGPFTFERQYRRKDGSLLDVWVSTRVISFRGRKAILVLAHDLTELMRARNALQESEARYRAVVEQSPDGIYLVDVETKQLLETNPALQKMFGYTAEEMQGLTPYDFTAAERENVEQTFREITTGADSLGFERQFRRKDNILLDTWVNANVIIFGGRKVACFLVRDITERKQATAERERIIGELQEALSRIKTLRGLIPICANCKKIRDDQGYWQQVETYVREHSEAEFSHGLCPECIEMLFPELKGNGGGPEGI